MRNRNRNVLAPGAGAWVAACLLTAALQVLVSGCSGPADDAWEPAGEPARPHIVFLLADDLGWNDVGYHRSEIETPQIDALAASGARLESLYASPTCSPTRAALMTGRYPMRYGLQSGVLRPHSTYGLPLTERTLASALWDAGYETSICGKWHLGFFEPAYRPTARGFEHQYGCYNGAIDYYAKERLGGLDWHRDDRPIVERREGRVELTDGEDGYVTDLIAREAVARIERRDPERPLFLYVPFTAPHAPLQVPLEELARFGSIEDLNRRTFAGMVHRMDACIGRILDALEREGMREDTLIVFASDNGGDTIFGASNAPFAGGKKELGEGGLRVPGIVVWPGRVEPRDLADPVSFVDWFPTLARVAGVEPGSNELDGVDLMPLLAGGGELERSELLLHLEPDRAALRSGRWKLVVYGELGAPEKVALFDVGKDLGETEDHAGERTDVVRNLLASLEAFASEAAPARGWPNDPPPQGFQPPRVWGEGQDED